METSRPSSLNFTASSDHPRASPMQHSNRTSGNNRGWGAIGLSGSTLAQRSTQPASVLLVTRSSRSHHAFSLPGTTCPRRPLERSSIAWNPVTFSSWSRHCDDITADPPLKWGGGGDKRKEKKNEKQVLANVTNRTKILKYHPPNSPPTALERIPKFKISKNKSCLLSSQAMYAACHISSITNPAIYKIKPFSKPNWIQALKLL